MNSTDLETGTLAYLTIREARAMLDGGDISAAELAEAALDRIYVSDDAIEAYEYVSSDIVERPGTGLSHHSTAYL